MKITQSLLSDIPIEKRETVLNKIKVFESALLESKCLSDIPKGFWIRRVAGTDIYKFRVNSGDRILFKYDKEDDKDIVVFIAYRNHDRQIRAAKNYKGSNSIVNLEIDKDEYIEDEFDEKINEYIKSEVYAKFEELKNELVIEDEYIALSIEENIDENMCFLSLEQYECLTKMNKPIIVFGGAGSGKTMIAIRRLIVNNDFKLKTAYITCSNMIVNKAKIMYSKFTDSNEYIYFFTFRDLCEKIIGVKEITVINYKEFSEWIYNNHIFDEEHYKISIREIWIEINSIIKGYVNQVTNKNILSEIEYLEYSNSQFDIKIKKLIYKIALKYNEWLRYNGYYDNNDLATIALENLSDEYKFNYVVYDEIQDLTNRQLFLIYSISRNVNNIMLLGDINQSINISRFNEEYIKDLIYENNVVLDKNIITKYYRNGSETVKWINEFKRIKNDKFKSRGKIFEIEEKAIKKGVKPRICYKITKEKEFFDLIDKKTSSIVIVPDERDKVELIEKGYEIGRVFSIEDVRGLEYNNIYCYNVLSKFDNIWGNVLYNDKKSDDIYSVYFNMVYIAATRAKNKLCFLEKNNTKLDNRFKEYWSILQDNNIILDEIRKHSDKDEWLKEAIKLEKMEKFYQAADAYKKAGRYTDADICLKAYERKINYSNSEKLASYVLISAIELNKSLLDITLNEIKRQYGVNIGGFINISVRYEDISGGSTVEKYIDESLSHMEIVDLIYSVLDQEYISKTEIVLKTCFYKDSVLIDVEKILGEGFRDFIIRFKGEIAKVEKTYLDELRLKDQVLGFIGSEYNSKLGFNPNNQAMRLRYDDKYKSKTSDEILDFIFKGEK